MSRRDVESDLPKMCTEQSPTAARLAFAVKALMTPDWIKDWILLWTALTDRPSWSARWRYGVREFTKRSLTSVRSISSNLCDNRLVITITFGRVRQNILMVQLFARASASRLESYTASWSSTGAAWRGLDRPRPSLYLILSMFRTFYTLGSVQKWGHEKDSVNTKR
jgi:hypothetical protein